VLSIFVGINKEEPTLEQGPLYFKVQSAGNDKNKQESVKQQHRLCHGRRFKTGGQKISVMAPLKVKTVARAHCATSNAD